MSWPTNVMAVPVTIISAGRTTDDYGQDVADWANTGEVDTFGWFSQVSGGEVMIDRDQQSFDATVWLPPATPITGRDRVVVFNDAYEVIGPPLRRRRPWSQTVEHHVRASLRRVEGPSGDGL